MHARKAILPDAVEIQQLITNYSDSGALLPRSLSEICENVRDFIVVEEDGRIVACGALHLYGMHLAEVRSITTDPAAQGKGAGAAVVRALLQEAEVHQVSCVCLFTRIPDFFAKLGFKPVAREDLPDKIYKDCVNCPRLHMCDEVAMAIGEVPKFAVLNGQNTIGKRLTKVQA